MTVTATKEGQGEAVTVLGVTNPATGQTIPVSASNTQPDQGSIFQTRSKPFCPIVALFLGVPLVFIVVGVRLLIGGIINPPEEPDLSTPAPTNARGEEIGTLSPLAGGVFFILFSLVFMAMFSSMQAWRLTVHPGGRVEAANVWGVTLLSFQAKGVEQFPPGCCNPQLSKSNGVQGCGTDPTSNFVVVEGASFCGRSKVAFTPQDSEGFVKAVQQALAPKQWQPGQGMNGEPAMDRA